MKNLAGSILFILSSFCLININVIKASNLLQGEAVKNNYYLLYDDRGSETGYIEISDTPEGLLIIGQVNHKIASWATNKDTLLINDHLELTITNENEFKLPLIGWGDQFQYHLLNSKEDCVQYPEDLDQCGLWYDKQLKYRDNLGKLFTRKWALSKNISKEIYASQAFKSLAHNVQLNLNNLKPQEYPNINFQAYNTENNNSRFKLAIPFELLPPQNSLKIKSLKFFMEVVIANGGLDNNIVYSTLPKNHPQGNEKLYNKYFFSKPHEYFITPCNFKLEDILKIGQVRDGEYPVFSEQAVVFYVPTKNQYLTNVLILENTSLGYQYFARDDSNSPILYEVPVWEHKINNEMIVCGPLLSVKLNSKIIQSDFILLDQELLEFQNFVDNKILLKYGPSLFYNYYGTGQGGGLAEALLKLLSLDNESGKIDLLFERHQRVEYDYDILVSTDGQNIKIYELIPNSESSIIDQDNLVWNTKEYVFNKDKYRYELVSEKNGGSAPVVRTLIPHPEKKKSQ